MLSELHVACAVSQMTIAISYTTVNVEYVVGPKTGRLVILGSKCCLVFMPYTVLAISESLILHTMTSRFPPHPFLVRRICAGIVICTRRVWMDITFGRATPTNDIVVTVTVTASQFSSQSTHATSNETKNA